MIEDEKERVVLRELLALVRLTTYHRVAVLTMNYLAKHLDDLPFLFLAPSLLP